MIPAQDPSSTWHIHSNQLPSEGRVNAACKCTETDFTPQNDQGISRAQAAAYVYEDASRRCAWDDLASCVMARMVCSCAAKHWQDDAFPSKLQLEVNMM